MNLPDTEFTDLFIKRILENRIKEFTRNAEETIEV